MTTNYKLSYLSIVYIAFLAAAFSMLFSALTSCGNRKDSQRGKMAVVISTMNNPWFVVLGQTAKAKAEELGYEVVIFDSQNNPSKEAEHFDNIISSGYDAVLFNPTDAEGSTVNAKSAMRSGVAVFCMDRELNDPKACVTQILSDNYSGCIALGQYFVEKLSDQSHSNQINYVEILGIVGDNNTWARSRGFHSVVDCFGNFHMLAQQTGEFDQNKAMEVMESMMQAHHDIQAVFCGNDAMAMGAYQAILGAGKAGEIKVFGFDGANDAVEAIREGKIEATGMQFPKTIAATAASLADKWLKGDKQLPHKLPVAVDLVTGGNVEHYGNFGKLD